MEEFVARARNLMRLVPLIDGHNDFPYMIRGWYGSYPTRPDLGIEDMPIGQTDLSRLRKSNLGGQFWSAFVPCTKDDQAASRLQVLKATIEQIDLIHQMIQFNQDILGLATSAEDIWRHHHSGRIASLIGVEGLHQIGGSPSILRAYHKLGVRYITLNHDSNNEYADSATSKFELHGGLSDSGVRLLMEMNRIGIMIDLSHTSHASQRQALEIAAAPLIFSHSSCYAIRNHPRNVPDDVLDALKLNRGIIMICFLRDLTAPDGPAGSGPTLKNVADHIEYAGKRIGYEHVGIGSDFDGMLEGPEGLDDVTHFPLLIAELLRRGLSEREVSLVMGLNIIRILDEVEAHAVKAMKDAKAPLNDVIESPWTEPQKQLLISKNHQRKADLVTDIDREELCIQALREHHC